MSARRAALAAPLLATAALLGGCAASPLRDRFDALSEQIGRAKDAGAGDHAPADLEQAQQNLDAARHLESASLEGRQSADDARKCAADDLERTEKSISDDHQALRECERCGRDAETKLAEARRHEDDLRNHGLTSDELSRAMGSDMAIAELAVTQEKARAATLREQISLLEIEAKAANERVTSAGIRREASGQTLLLARALAEQGLASARMAEARALAARRAEIDGRARSTRTGGAS
jgi:hypothetical protein